jgi:hypothetical protein
MSLTVYELEGISIFSLNLDGKYPDSNLFPEKKAIAETVKPNCAYLNSIYNATTKQILCQVFTSGEFLVRVYSDNTTKLFQENAVVNGVKYDYVYFENNEPIAYYMPTGDDISFSKHDFATRTQQWITYSQHYDTIPEDKKPLLADFAYNNQIFAWSDQDIGFVVEFIEVTV